MARSSHSHKPRAEALPIAPAESEPTDSWVFAFAHWRAQLLLWTFVAAIPIVQGWADSWLGPGPDLPGWRLVLYHLPLWWLWLPLTPLVQWLGRVFPVTARRGLYALAVHLPASLLVAVFHQAVGLLWWRAIGLPGTATAFSDSLTSLLRSANLQTDLFAYWAVLVVVSAHRVYRQVLEREVENSHLRYRLSQARIRALKTQLHPHFMFNALNAVSALVIRKDAPSAERMLGQLAEFVRLTLSDSGQEIALADDVALAEKYLSIEQVRFEDRLRFTVDVDPQVADALVPQLLLQPVVENAVRHGISPRARGGTIAIRAERRRDRVFIEVKDDGVGLPDARVTIRRRSDGGIGLSNTRDRLQHLYGNDYGFEITGAPEQGTRVAFDLPFHTSKTRRLPTPGGRTPGGRTPGGRTPGGRTPGGPPREAQRA